MVVTSGLSKENYIAFKKEIKSRCSREKMSEYCIVNSSIILNTLKKLKESECNNAYVCI